MSTKTPNYNLTKPDLSENGDINVINGNFEIIDTELFKKANKPSVITTGNLLEMDSSGNPCDSGKKKSDFAATVHTHTKSQITDLGALEPLAWNNITFQSGYVNVSVSKYTKTSFGTVQLAAIFQKNSAVATNDVVLNLPIGFRPSTYIKVEIATPVLGSTLAFLGPDGNLSVNGWGVPSLPAGTVLSISATYKAEG